MPAVNEEITKAPPRERTVIEGNIVEHPIWKLSNPQDRPKRLMVDKETGKVLVDPGTMKPREDVDPEDYTQVIDLGPDPADPHGSTGGVRPWTPKGLRPRRAPRSRSAVAYAPERSRWGWCAHRPPHSRTDRSPLAWAHASGAVAMV